MQPSVWVNNNNNNNNNNINNRSVDNEKFECPLKCL